MKLYNRTKCPDEILQPLLRIAGQSVGAHTAGVIVILSQGRYRRESGGHAHSASAIKRSFTANRWVRTDGGYVTITIPNMQGTDYRSKDAVDLAFAFLRIAAHEFGHIRDMQRGLGLMPWSKAQPGKRRPRWAVRPEEIRAVNYTDDALDKLRRTRAADDAVLALAEWFEKAAQHFACLLQNFAV